MPPTAAVAAPPLPGARAALVIGHPGHELRVHGWLCLARPVTCVLTDGSGPGGAARLGSTADVLAAAGARPAPVFGRFTDREVYEALLAGDVARFEEVAEALVDLFIRETIDYVLGDAAEGFNPAHDLCRVLVDVAVVRARARGRSIANLEFPLEGPPHRVPRSPGEAPVILRLDDRAFARKRAAATAYTAMAREIQRAIGAYGERAFRTECLRPAEGNAGTVASATPLPYERCGEARVAAGRYLRVVREREHLMPIAAALWRGAVRPG
jgi:hypothetical protein